MKITGVNLKITPVNLTHSGHTNESDFVDEIVSSNQQSMIYYLFSAPNKEMIPGTIVLKAVHTQPSVLPGTSTSSRKSS